MASCRPVLVQAPTANKKDDFESPVPLDGDDLFAFDEELSSTIAPDRTTEIKDELDFEDETDASSSKALEETGTSPHAGSLPIEIKWPGRRDSDESG